MSVDVLISRRSLVLIHNIDVTLDDLEWHKNELLSKVHVDLLVTGNIQEAVRACSTYHSRRKLLMSHFCTLKSATEIMQAVEGHLKSRALPPAEWPRDRSLLLPSGAYKYCGPI